MHIQLDRQLTFHEQRELVEQIQFHLYNSCLPQYKEQFQSIELYIDAQTLGEVINDCLKPYCTQHAGGFEVSGLLSQTEIKERLTEEIVAFDSLVLGVESSLDSRFPIEGTHCAEVSVYNRSVTVSPQLILRTDRSGKQKMKLHAVQHRNRQTIWLGHTSSGTRDVVKSKMNQELLKMFINGVMTQDRFFDREQDIFFGDVNFDATDTNILKQLSQWSRDFDVQFVLPRVRVTKTRYGNRPFANNQMHKNYTQIAESMLAIVPNHQVVLPLDDDGLVVVRNGTIQTHCLGKSISGVVEINQINWVQHNAFSDAVPLDHKPICCMIGTESYQFHNWMDFGGLKGIRLQSWYDEVRLIEEEKKLMTYLKERFPSVY